MNKQIIWKSALHSGCQVVFDNPHEWKLGEIDDAFERIFLKRSMPFGVKLMSLASLIESQPYPEKGIFS